jgi:hypothetical protein
MSAPRYLVVYRQAGNDDDGKSAAVELYTTRDRRLARRAVTMLNYIEAECVERTGGYPGEAYLVDLTREPLPDVTTCIDEWAEMHADARGYRRTGKI